MSVIQYSKKRDGNIQLTKNFKLFEFDCKDGADEVRVSPETLDILQKIRDYVGVGVHVNSGYRTPSHNAKVGGVPNSQHIVGTAADIRTKGASPLEVAQVAEILGASGIGLYSDFTHVDTRPKPAKWYSHDNKGCGGTFLPDLKRGAKDSTCPRKIKFVSQLQTMLKRRGCNPGNVDGSYGPATEDAVKAYQEQHNLTPSGSVTRALWTSLYTSI